jgi:hypothetical protein
VWPPFGGKPGSTLRIFKISSWCKWLNRDFVLVEWRTAYQKQLTLRLELVVLVAMMQRSDLLEVASGI